MATDPRLEAALRELEVAANNFAARLARIAEVRLEYVAQIRVPWALHRARSWP